MNEEINVMDITGLIADAKKRDANIKFTAAQKDFICYEIGEWYLGCKDNLVDHDQRTNRLGSAKELLKVTICGDSMESDEERKCVYNLLVDSGGDAWETDYYSNCGTSYPSDAEFEQPGTGNNIYCWKCGGKIEAVKEVVSDE